MRRAQRRKYHFFYKTTCLITNRYYYGMHSTDNLNDGYIGSGKRLWYSINKYGRQNHKIEILEFFDTREKLRNKEAEIVNEDLIKDPLCMNLQLGGGGGFINEEHAKKFHANGGKAVYRLLCHRHHEKLKNNGEYRQNYSEIMRIATTGEKNGFWKKTHTEETKEKMRNHKGKAVGNKNSQYGTCWITNGKENKKIKKEDIIPNGWYLGRKLI